MKQTLIILVSCLFIACASMATATVVLNDPFGGSTVGTASGIEWGPGLNGRAAYFGESTDYIKFSKVYFPAIGTISFSYQRANTAVSGYDWTIFDTVGNGTKANGDFRLLLTSGSSNVLAFNIWNGGAWQSVVGTTQINADVWTNIELSYGNKGMALYVNGVQEAFNGTYTFSRDTNDAMYIGDCPLDTMSYGLLGKMDNLLVSDAQKDLVLAPAVPEPSSVLALVSGLLSSAAFIRRRRK